MDNVLFSINETPNFWEGCLAALRHILSESAVEMWFGNIRFEGFSEDGCALLVAGNSLAASWVESHYRDALIASLKKIAPSVGNYFIRVSEQSKASPVPVLVPACPFPPAKPASRIAAEAFARETDKILSSFYPSYSFENFVEGDCNRIALTVSRTVAENPGGNQMNPLVLYGGTGVGKTHLLQSIGRYAITYKTATKVVYRTAEQFLKDFVKMSFAKTDRLQVEREFRDTYQDADMLLIDDVQVLAGKERSQEELFKLISRLMSHRKQVIFCCDRRPSEVPQLSERLLSRFESGMSVSLNAPDVMTRISILRRKAACLNIPKEDCEAIFQWVATHQAGNVREIEGLITKLLAYHDLMGLDCNLETIKQLFGAMESEKNDGIVQTVKVRSIIDATALAFGLAPALLSSQTRIQAVSLPRKIAMYLCREMTQESLKTIGFHFNRDYATVIASGKSIERRLLGDPALQEKIQEIRLALQS